MAAYQPVPLPEHVDDEQDGLDDIELEKHELKTRDSPTFDESSPLDEDRPGPMTSSRRHGFQWRIKDLRWKLSRPNTSDLTSVLVQCLPRYLRPSSLRLTQPLGPTAYLDALRGYAAWNVFLAHGYKDYNFTWRDQPFLSALMAGEAMVSLFFVISGYVLAYRLLINTRNRSSDKLLSSLASSTFRRGIRLYGSTTVALFAALVMVRLGWYNGGYGLYIDSIWAQLWDWCLTLLFFMNPFVDIRGYHYKQTLENKYLGVMWTIPVEFRGSMILFIYIAGTCKLRVYARMALSSAFIVTCYIWDAIYVAEFLMGMLVAEIALKRNPERLGTRSTLPQHTTSPRRQSLISKIIWSLVLITAIFFLGEPISSTRLGFLGDWPWAALRQVIPSWYKSTDEIYFYLGIGSFLMVLALEMYPTLQAPLRCGWSQYVGELSFGIYALHVPLLIAVIAQWYNPAVRVPNGWTSAWGVLPGAIIMHFLVFACADYFNRVDRRVVKLGRWLQERAFEKWD